MKSREVINDVLVHLFNEIMELEEQAIITEEYKDISNNDMHIMEAVGLGGNKMSDIAAKLNITLGSLTTSMNSLVKKGYAERERSEQDRRVVFIHLTEKGRRAYHHHAEFHRKMVDAVMDTLDETEIPVLGKALEGLAGFFRQYRS
ncbi:MarR family winged helix-turn-helix transcriptional regulator [Ruminococcus sp. 5_1_39BFAA]|uniref:MarR family winged helix-turn-helix transcriptional regulator n=1 Tax=Ruminococcus sp. 5_1_39BFAA TaxID=457412 RepID=UPI003567F350